MDATGPHRVRIRQAGPDDVAELARLLWLHASEEERDAQSAAGLTGDLGPWWATHDSHHAFLAVVAGPSDVAQAVGMAWLALVPRVPRPGTTTRLSADLQSVFVVPEERGRGVGSALVAATVEHAAVLGSPRVTVHSGRRAVPVYQRLGFESSPLLMQRGPV